MTKCLRSLQRIGLCRNVWRTCLLAGSALLAMSLFFSCNQNVRPGSGTGGAIEKTYTVNHNWEKVDGTGYDTAPQTGLKGLVGSGTKAVAQEKKGFELDTAKHPAGKIKQENIKADGSTVVNIYYARKTITLTFDPNGGKFGSSADNKKVQGKYGEMVTETITKPEKAGMKFSSWKSRTEVRVDPPATFPEEDVTYTAQWNSLESANYTVRHWKQPIIGDTYTDKVEESLSGIVDEDTQAQAKTYQNFHLSKVRHVDGKIVQQKIKADGLTIVDIYYDRNIFTAKFNTDGGNSISDISGRYEAGLLPPAKPTKEGKEFVKWEPPVPTSFTEDTVHKAIWQDPPPKQATYKVEHWTQKVDPGTGKVRPADTHTPDNYALQDEDTNKTGKIGELTAANARTDAKYKGYETPTVTQETIEADGSTVVKIYYVRKTVTLTFDAKGGKIGSEPTKILTGKYGEKIESNEVPNPSRDADYFSKWKPDYPLNFPAESTTYEAQWAVLTSIEVAAQPTKKEYIVGEDFDKTGLQVKAKYSDGSNPLLTYGVDYTTNFDSIKNTVGANQTVTIKHEKDVTKTATFEVTIKEKPAVTYEVGDIIDSTDNKKYKAAGFTALPANSPKWSNYYVIVKVNSASYIGVRYLDNTGYGEVELGTSPSGAYPYNAKPRFPHRYLEKSDIKAIVDNAAIVKVSMDKIKAISGLTAYTNENCIASEDNGYSFTNGNGDTIYSSSSGSFIPFAAREFN